MEKLSEKMHNMNEDLLELQREFKALSKGQAYKDKNKRAPEVYASACSHIRFCIARMCYLWSHKLRVTS